MKGKISQWHDDKGFGFIISDDGAKKVFFHISSVKTNSRRPQVGESVVYEVILDDKQRLQAKAVMIEGLVGQATQQRKSQHNQAPRHRKNALDFLLLLIMLSCLGKISWDFFQLRLFNAAMAPYAITAVFTFLALSRPKKPKAKQFNCAGCKAVTPFNARTIQAWNNGFLKLYCNSCHQHWLRENPAPAVQHHAVGRGSGCLVLLCVLSSLPVLAAVAAYQWMT